MFPIFKQQNLMIISNINDFAKHLKINHPIISIDYGQKKIGVAISDSNLIMSLPLVTLTNNPKQFTSEISKIIIKHNIFGIVVGLPVNMDGTKSIRSDDVIKFAEILVRITKQPAFMQDERLTSRAADNLLKLAGFNRKQRNQNDDQIAACLILDSVLQTLKNIS